MCGVRLAAALRALLSFSFLATVGAAAPPTSRSTTAALPQVPDRGECGVGGAPALQPSRAAPQDSLGLFQDCVGLFQNHLDYVLAADRAASAAKSNATLPLAAIEEAFGLREALNASADPLATGVSLNEEGDFQSFIANLYTEVGVVLAAYTVLSVLRLRFPMIYQNRIANNEAPVDSLPDTFLGWFHPARTLELDKAQAAAGLDIRMLLEFCDLCKRMCLFIGGPMVLVTGILNYFAGGHAAGNDHMSYISMGNVQDGSWVYYIHAVVVWIVVVVVKMFVFQNMHGFLRLRWLWLRDMADLRACTILVENIPEEYQSDDKLKEFFDHRERGDEVVSAYVAKDTMKLPKLVAQLKDMRDHLQKAEKGEGPKEVRVTWFGPKENPIPYYKEQIITLRREVDTELKELNALHNVEGSTIYCSRGFVTFKDRKSVEHVLPLSGKYSEDEEEWQLSNPPIPQDVRWQDMCQDPNAEMGRSVLGYVLVAGLYFLYLPCVIGITNIASAINLGPILQPYWASIVPTLGLTLMVSFLPTFIRLIFTLCFTHVADRWVQHDLQKWYFVFQVVFVLLATAVGQNVTQFTKKLVQEPLGAFGMLADTLPYATHFYMNYLVIQWATHAINLTRFFLLLKYLFFRSMRYNVEDAKSMAEPEDQDYYGIGSRSARWTVNMLIPLIYGTLSPPMFLLAWVNFYIQRVNYGFLMCFSESTKADLGGVFYVTKLRHILRGVIIYVVLMTGVLLHRAGPIPTAIAASSLVHAVWACYRFDDRFNWYRLPLKAKLTEDDLKLLQEGKGKQRELQGSYEQPEVREAELLLQEIPETPRQTA